MKVTLFCISMLLLIPNLALSQDTITLKQDFVPSEAEWVKNEGTSKVDGEAYLKLKNGEYRGCAGFNIELLPASKYANERIFRTYGNNTQGQILMSENPPKFSPDIKEYHEYLLKTKCDENNYFSFSNIPAGEYYVIAFIIWGDAPNLKGGGAMKNVHVGEGESRNVVLKR